MQTIATYFARKVIWADYDTIMDNLPDKDWVCLAIANSVPDIEMFSRFVSAAIAKDILEFKGFGYFGGKLHDLFDEIIINMEMSEGHPYIDTMTTWHDDETLADTFWQCFFSTCLPERTDHDNVKIVCIDLDGVNRVHELQQYIHEFELGWLPSVNVKHEIWQDDDGQTTMRLADQRGDKYRVLTKSGNKRIHEFYAESHYEAMTLYYRYMGWGKYTSESETDNEPYA